MAKRTKQLQAVVDMCNEMFRNNRVIDPLESDASLLSHILIQLDCYKGYNWFYEDRSYTDGVMLRLVGSGMQDIVREKDGFIQFY